MQAEALCREFTSRAVSGSGGLMLQPADALQLVNRAAEAGVPIVRVGGFQLRGQSTQPSPADTADYAAAVSEGHGCWTDAEAFIHERMDRGLVFELTLGSDPINAA